MPVDVQSVTGAPGAGKTATLAEIAVARSTHGRVLVICSHPSSCRAFVRALARKDGVHSSIVVGTLADHLSQFMRADYLSAGVAPKFATGGPEAAADIVDRAARGLWELSWPELLDESIDLDVPFARRPAALLEEATSLFELLRRSRISVSDFEAGCNSGLIAFYGDDVERARDLLREAQRTGRGSKRAREAMLASDGGLRVQRRAERDLSVLLVRWYREYVAAARLSATKSESEIIGSGLDWLSSDAAAAAGAFAGCSALLVDDAEDAEPALEELLGIAVACGIPFVAVAGREESAVDELHGRRALTLPPSTPVVNAGPPPAQPVSDVRRFAAEDDEAAWIARRVTDCLDAGARPEDIAVLTRDRDGARVYARLLAALGLPALPPADLYAADDEVADLFALAHIVDDPYDQAHLLRVLASPLLGFSDATLWTLCGDAPTAAQLQLDVGGGDQKRGRDRGAVRTLLSDNVLYGGADEALPEPTRVVLRAFRHRFTAWRASCAALAPSDAFSLLARDSGFAAHWHRQKPYAAMRRDDDLARIVDALDVATSAGIAGGLGAAVEALESGLVAPREAARTAGALVVDGIVDVKGERFAHVIVAGVAHERFPRIYVARAMAFSRKYGLIARENVANGAAQTAKFAWYYAWFEAKRRYLEGERRALRYGLSRGIASSAATGFGTPPRWAKEEDLLAEFLGTRP